MDIESVRPPARVTFLTVMRSVRQRWSGTRRARLVVLLPVVLVAVWGAFHVASATREQMQTTPDSASYLGIADNLRHGHGPTVPFTWVWDRYSVRTAERFLGHVPSTHFPPGYPIALAISSTLTGSSKSAARLLAVGCMAVNLFLIGLLAACMTGFRSVIVAVLPPLMLLYVADTPLFAFESPGWVAGHETVWSEPLFVAFFTAALIVAGLAISSKPPRSRYALMGAAALAGAAFFTRYVGLSGVLAIAVALVCLDRRRALVDRLRRAAMFGAAAVAPVAINSIGAAIAGSNGARTLAYHPQPRTTRDTFDNLGHALFPITWPDGRLVVGVVAVAAVAVCSLVWLPGRARPDARPHDDRVLLWLALLAVACYLAVVVITRTFFDRAVAIDPRLFIGLRGIWTAVVVVGLYRAMSAYTRPFVASVVLAVLVGLVVHADWPTQAAWLRRIEPTRTTAVEQALVRLPPDAFIVGNSPDIVYLASRRPSLLLPSRDVYVTGKANPTYGREVDDFARLLRSRGGYAFFSERFDRVLSPAELEKRVAMRLLVSADGQSLFEIRPGTSGFSGTS